MGKLDILKPLIKDLAEEYSAACCTYLCIGEKVITDTLSGEYDVERSEFTDTFADGQTKISAEKLKGIAMRIQKRDFAYDWEKAYSFDDDGNGMICRNDNGFIRYTVCCGERIIYICIDEQCGELFIHADTESKESFVRAVLDNIEILTVTPKSPSLEKYGRANAGRTVRLSIEPYQLFYACDIKSALCYAYAYGRESYVLRDNLRITGVVVLNEKGSNCEIEYAAIDRRYAHKGYGTILIEKALSLLKEKGAKRVTISVHPENRAALHVYEKCGFVKEREERECVVLGYRC